MFPLGWRGRFGCIAADPPWRFETWSRKNQTRAPSYDLMSVADIKALPVAEIAAPDSVLLLWAINSMIPDALDVMAAWGFTFKTIGFTWAKTTRRSAGSFAPSYHMGLGYWTRQNTESCLLGVRGRPKRSGRDVRQLLVAPCREHSRKPDEFYRSAERLLAGPFVELFSRASQPGWDVWGSETGLFDRVSAVDLLAERPPHG